MTRRLRRVAIHVSSQDIERASLHTSRPLWAHAYAVPFLLLYPIWAYAYYFKYDDWVKSEEWTFLGCVALGAGHALSFLATRWSAGAKALITSGSAQNVEEADLIRLVPFKHRGKGEIVHITKKRSSGSLIPAYSFNYQRDTYVYNPTTNSFEARPYPSDSRPPLSSFASPSGVAGTSVDSLRELYGMNEFDIPIPSFTELFGEHATAPFFVFQLFCVALWCLDEYWYYSLFTAFMLVVFECTVVWQRVRTLTEFRTMSITPFSIQVLRDDKWEQIQTDKLVPGDLVSIVRGVKEETTVPADLLLIQGTVIVNEAMLSGESTPLLKSPLDVDSQHKGNILFSGTKILQASGGTRQLVRTMIFSTERVSANNLESFLFIGFLLIFAIAASWYVWVRGIERGLKKSKLLLDCILIVTSVVPPELPMELSLAVNASLVALSKFAIFCTEPFRIPFAGRVDVCCFDKTGTITAENLVLEGVAGVDPSNPRKLVNVKEASRDTTLCLAAAHALVQLDDGTIVGDPMEKTTLESLDWAVSRDVVTAREKTAPHRTSISIRRRFQFSSALKRMSTVSHLPTGAVLVAVKGAPETIKSMLSSIPKDYDETFKWYTRRGSRVLALGTKELPNMGADKIHRLQRERVESQLRFAGFFVSLKMLADSSHRCIMITGDNPLTAVHIVDRDALILDVRGGCNYLQWRTVDGGKIISVDPSEPIDVSLFNEYDICVTGAALRQYEGRAGINDLVNNTWVYARVSPTQKEYILTTLKNLGYTTLMAGDGTNDVGALKQADVGVALLDGTPADLQKIAEHQRNERVKSVYESQLKISQRFNQPPPPVPPAIASLYPELVAAQQKAKEAQADARKKNPMEKFDLASITNTMADLDDDNEPPKIKLGDASCAAPFTSKLSNVSAITNIIRQGRCTLVATIQMYKILALNCLITAYSLSVQYLDGIKFGDYQVTITGILMSVCFLCISRAKPVEQLSRERPLGNIFNFYVLLSVLIQFAIHIASLVYITNLSNLFEVRGPIDLDAKFEPNLLNTAIYLLSLSQQVSTFAINFQGRPFREGIRENSALWWGLVGASAVAFSGATDFIPELNRWLQIVEMQNSFKFSLTTAMILDFAGCWVVEVACKAFFADLAPKPIVLKGWKRREKRRTEQLRLEQLEKAKAELAEQKED
ncbi:endoplasmic reticulum Ca-transporting P-type ATPase [Cantharellus anzutake]|uniref:endoplasmic reticulum Ca-transporting P-type ATPase n=1 Tax=Cantharellus anzutake TaxID=1750568 RepID=UPI001906A459|nr:endoplasmic reticulum Ca-transporting P-type ATPase [Cantharellus anzutake]KAF8324139.1 endoplasmic reticulum Ca-transporting P-type ATPase [Cantharellus anzutake]